jgi:hypothetical protein
MERNKMNYDMSIHTNPDAVAWAQFYCKTIKENPEIVIDESYMIAWFSNAMMAMHDYLVLQGNPINGDHAEYMIDSVSSRIG